MKMRRVTVSEIRQNFRYFSVQFVTRYVAREGSCDVVKFWEEF